MPVSVHSRPNLTPKREKFSVRVECKCGQVGHATWEENAEVTPQGPQAVLLSVSSGFYDGSANLTPDRPKSRADYTHEFLANILGANRKSVTLPAQSMQTAGLISYRTIQVLNRKGLEKASCECYAIVRERFDAFLKPPGTAVR